MTEKINPYLLETKGIAKSYGSVVALTSVDLVVRHGEIHSLLGANGAGKSTLVKILAGVQSADAGELHVNGKPGYFHSPADAMEAGISTVFQDPSLIPDLTIEQNLRISNIEESKFREWLEWFNLGKLDLSALVRELPLETLRIADLARAVARKPHLLLLDELTAALTADQAERVFKLLAYWKESGNSAVLITHRLAEVMRICDRATILRNGHNVDVLETSKVNEHQLVEAMLGQLAESGSEENKRNVDRSYGDPALTIIELSSGDVVRNVSFSVKAGEILGIVALEGQGQDRLFELLSGDRQPSSGKILVHGTTRQFRSPFDAVQSGVVLVPGDRLRSLMPDLSIRQNLAIPLFNRIREWFGLPRDENEKVASAIDQLSIDTRAASQVRRLSGG
ncbi:MAG TPA: sugar ABC transporter ATP-binding protein, partial [Anaerolineales bacterium]|nr:sugar ABC transporter ATP-binding protein [Anaerolineales bacterium]